VVSVVLDIGAGGRVGQDGPVPHDAATGPSVLERAQELLEELAGPDARLRDDQARAIEAVVGERRRALVVQRTGFGKSAIYFIACRLLRDAGHGPTLVVSPLLALMRDQIAAAGRMGVRAATINSTNLDEWDEIEERIARGELDLLAISPERLNNPGFVRRVLPRLAHGLGLLVVDEAHCISDWGHDFRPDYRRIRDAIAALEPGTPVLATTATANSRVEADVAEQLGTDVLTLRGTLDRESLHLGVAQLPDLAHRLAWLATRIPELPGTGIVYCLTVAHTALAADFLRTRGIDAAAYSSDVDSDERTRLEAAFQANELQCLVATSALGMGVDKPDVTFVFHLGAPPSPIAYYQQVGRAGRSVDRAEAWLLPSSEDQRIWDWFASVGLPPEALVRRTLDALDGPDGEPATVPAIEQRVDLKRTRLETLLKILDVDGAVERVGRGWVRTGQPWVYDQERVARIEQARDAEAQAMFTYAQGERCLMQFLREALDDPGAAPCGRCTVCTGRGDAVELDPALLAAAVAHLRGVEITVEPRKQWASGLTAPKGTIKPAQRADVGRSLAREGDAGWWPAVERTLGAGTVDDELVAGIVATLKRWDWTARPRWVTWVPSRARGPLLAELADRIGAIGKLPVHAALVRPTGAPDRRQADLQNSTHRLANAWASLAVDPGELPPGDQLAGPVLVVDDLLDSGWTMTVAASLLRGAGAGAVLPLTLVRR
jgi:ATP-dependent DNA helicase RecQ